MQEEVEIEVDFSQYAQIICGVVVVTQRIECASCHLPGLLCIDMRLVDENDHVKSLCCPECGEESIDVVTYRES